MEIEGFQVSGTRMVVKNPLEMGMGSMTQDTWLSPKLGLVLLSKQTRFDGETVQRYENIRLGEPPSEAFMIPSGYTVSVPLTQENKR